MATLFISDLHLSGERPALTELFRGFLAGPAREAEALYILGDLFEVWLGDDAVLPDARPVLEEMRRCTDAGVPIFVMHGNRDFLLGEGFAAMTGATLLADPTVLDLYGTPTLLMHGDSLCIDDVDYQKFRAMVRNPEWQRQAMALSPEERARMAGEIRAESKKQNQLKAEYIMDVNAQAVEQAMREHGVARLIHGHTHRPAQHELELDGRSARRIVLADWDDRGSMLVCDQHGCHFHPYP